MKYPAAFLSGVMLILTTLNLSAQTIVTGKVTDAETKSPLPYASIRIKEKALGVVTNEQGDFTLTLNSSPENYTLVISFVGFKPYEIALTKFIERKNKTLELEPLAHELQSATLSEGKFDVHEFMATVIQAYQSGSRTTPHIARAYFQEQVTVKFKPVLFAEGIGYSAYLGEIENQAARSNYKFFYEQVSVNRDYKSWTDYIDKLGKTTDHRFGASDNLNNFRTFELNGPLSDNGKKFKYKLDSTLSYRGQTCLLIKFKGTRQSGQMIIGEETLQVWAIAYNASETIWSNTFNDRVEGSFVCTYDYDEGQHYLSEALSIYSKGDITHWNRFKIVAQKFDTLELSDKEYWDINKLDYFTIGQAKSSEKSFELYSFPHRNADQRLKFKEGFTTLTIDAEKNPDYEELLAKLSAFF